MTVALNPAISPWSKALIKDLSRKAFRDAYVEDHVRVGLAFQIRVLREQRGWTQAKMAEVTNTTQSVISRLENPDYGKLSLQTLLEIAAALDVPLLVQYVNWDDWLTRTANVSPTNLRKHSFDAGRLLALAGTGARATARIPLGFTQSETDFLSGKEQSTQKKTVVLTESRPYTDSQLYKNQSIKSDQSTKWLDNQVSGATL